MKVVCVEQWIWFPDIYVPLVIGKVYDCKEIFKEKSNDGSLADIEWDKNMLIIDGYPVDVWFPTKYFMRMEEYRQIQLDKIL